MNARTKLKALNGLVLAASALMILYLLWRIWRYNQAIHASMRGGWDSHAFEACVVSFSPWFLVVLIPLIPWWRWGRISCGIGYSLLGLALLFFIYTAWVGILHVPILFLLLTLYAARAVWLFLEGQQRSAELMAAD
jgi:hypothetical protein